MSPYTKRSLRVLLQDFITYHLQQQELPEDHRSQETYTSVLEALAGELNRRIYQLTQPGRPDEWFYLSGGMFNLAMVESVTGDRQACAVNYQEFIHEFEGEEAALVWDHFQQRCQNAIAPTASWPEEELHG